MLERYNGIPYKTLNTEGQKAELYLIIFFNNQNWMNITNCKIYDYEWATMQENFRADETI
jgi:hypothetical protein